LRKITLAGGIRGGAVGVDYAGWVASRIVAIGAAIYQPHDEKGII
jgi:hypothetical protein